MKIYKKIESKNYVLYVFETSDKQRIESVFVKDWPSICISTQIGCNVGCIFCASCKKGFFRNLTEEELLDQINYISREQKKVIDINFAGMGEPLNNFNNVVACFNKIKGKFKNIQIFTSVPSVELLHRLLKIDFERITISLHGLDADTRKKIIPRSVKPEEIIKCLKEEINKNNRLRNIIYLGYLLLHKINDSKKDIDKLITIAKELNVPIRLMHYNKIGENIDYSVPTQVFLSISEYIKKKGVILKVIPPKEDKLGECGTLVLNREI
jgi:23S rRNA (adenine2503-C2)-methyltransferase